MTQLAFSKRLYSSYSVATVVGLFTFLVSSFSFAVQRVEVRDNGTSMAQISLHESTRIKVENAAITDVVGNVFHKDRNAGGEIMVDEDKARGEIFVSLVTAQTKPVNLFIVTASATYTLLLHPSDLPSDTIILVDKNQKILSESPTSPSSANHIRNLMMAMSIDRASTSMRVTETNREVAFKPAARLTMLRQFESGDLTGERYLLTNIGTRVITLLEQEFYSTGVVAVAIERTALLPNESSAIYVIKPSQEARR